MAAAVFIVSLLTASANSPYFTQTQYPLLHTFHNFPAERKGNLIFPRLGIFFVGGNANILLIHQNFYRKYKSHI